MRSFRFKVDFYAYWNRYHFALLPNLRYDALCDGIWEISFEWLGFQIGIVKS